MGISQLQYTLVTIQKLISFKPSQMVYRLIKQNKLSTRWLLNKDDMNDMNNLKILEGLLFGKDSLKTKKIILIKRAMSLFV